MSDRRRRDLITAAFFAWLALVWGHSLMPGDMSVDESSLVLRLVRPLFELIGLHDPNDMMFAVRKCAHFSEYVVLASLAWAMVGEWCADARRRRALTAAIVLVVPVVDEFIQLHVPGRCGTPTDVCIDLAGCTVALLVCWAVGRARQRQEMRS